MPNLLDLPDEIVVLILRNLVNHAVDRDGNELGDIVTSSFERQTVTLASVTRASRRLHRLSTALLYTNVSLAEGNLDQTLAFMRTLLENPELLPSIRQLSVGDDLSYWKEQDEGELGYDADKPSPLSQLTERGVESLKAIIDRVFKPCQHIIAHEHCEQQCLRRTTPGLVLVLLVAHMPALQTLDILGGSPFLWDELSSVVHCMTKSPEPSSNVIPLSLLHTVSMGRLMEYQKSGNDSMPLALVSQWHALRIIDSYTMGERRSDDHWNLEPNSGNFRSLALREKSKIGSEDLSRLLDACKELEILEYHIGHEWEWHEFNANDLFQALDQHKSSLEQLRLVIIDNESEAQTWVPADLSQYKALKELHISYAMLYGRGLEELEPGEVKAFTLRALPPSLESLCISSFSSRREADLVADTFATIIQHDEDCFTNLTELTAAPSRNDTSKKCIGHFLAVARDAPRKEVNFRMAAQSDDDIDLVQSKKWSRELDKALQA